MAHPPGSPEVMQWKGHDVTCSQGVPQDRFHRTVALGAGDSGGCRAQGSPEVSSCLCSRDGDRTAHSQQCSIKLHEGGNKDLIFLSPAQLVLPEEEVLGFSVALLSAEEIPTASTTSARTESWQTFPRPSH